MNPINLVEGSPAIKSTTIAYSENFLLTIGGILNIYNNINNTDVEKILDTGNIKQIQFAYKFNILKSTYNLINESLLSHDTKPILRLILNGEQGIENLDCLEYLTNTKSLTVEMFKNKDTQNINKYLKLEHLAIGGQNLSIDFISKQKNLKSLFVFEKIKDIEVINELVNLEKLTFSKLTLKNLDFLTPLENLSELNFILGSATNYDKLPEIGKINTLTFTRVRKLSQDHLNSINKMAYLEKIIFDTQSNITNLNWLINTSVTVEANNCKNLV